MRERRWTLPDDVRMLPGRGYASTVVAPAPRHVIRRSSWKPGCPVAATDLAWVRMAFWGFDGQRHTGELLVHRTVAADIAHARPDIVWVGLSTPKQELWMAAHRGKLEAPVLIGVGAAFDIHAGLIDRAPRFLRRTGFEWTYRLFKEPRRLWRRYLANNPRFVALVILQKMGLRTPPLPSRP